MISNKLLDFGGYPYHDADPEISKRNFIIRGYCGNYQLSWRRFSLSSCFYL